MNQVYKHTTIEILSDRTIIGFISESLSEEDWFSDGKPSANAILYHLLAKSFRGFENNEETLCRETERGELTLRFDGDILAKSLCEIIKAVTDGQSLETYFKMYRCTEIIDTEIWPNGDRNLN